MRKLLVGALSAALVAGIPALASAQGSLSVSGEEATMICRPARGGEQATAQTLQAQQQLVCRNITIQLEPNEQLRVVGSVTVHGDTQPPFPGLSGDALSHAWTQWFIDVMRVTYGGS